MNAQFHLGHRSLLCLQDLLHSCEGSTNCSWKDATYGCTQLSTCTHRLKWMVLAQCSHCTWLHTRLLWEKNWYAHHSWRCEWVESERCRVCCAPNTSRPHMCWEPLECGKRLHSQQTLHLRATHISQHCMLWQKKSQTPFEGGIELVPAPSSAALVGRELEKTGESNQRVCRWHWMEGITASTTSHEAHSLANDWASLSEPHTDDFNGTHIYIYICILYMHCTSYCIFPFAGT